MNQTSPTFELAPATRADIPRLAYIHFDNPKVFEQRATEMLEGQVGEPNWQHIKLVDKDTGEITTWASWNTPTDVEIRERDEKAAAKILASTKDLDKGEFDFLPGLPMFVQADIDRWLERWTKGQRHILCKAIFTEPTFQRRGMGRALVENGNKLADKKGLPIFMQVSPFGFPLHMKHGFETVQCLDVDFRE
ncbi:hypothetical protein BELL_0054g00090 [Botrytis elliptica]|uniref:N-acetyltransferase domain-containing protein n=1 Tax=Botrytis elliptica TaxID=278938 RepID=A0A4Z1JXZ5_9HELO|nr:hypothetical protein EAE99_008566 [Botrytis elliptica]TGO78771.1 hypothetical protein BELL_0054g00090 [Botrytis elliptica]